MLMLSRMLEEINLSKGSQDKIILEVHQGNLHPLGSKVYFLVIVILVQILGTRQRIVGHTTRTNIMVPISFLEETLQE